MLISLRNEQNVYFKDAAWKTEGFLHTLFLKNEQQTSQKIQGDVFLFN